LWPAQKRAQATILNRRVTHEQTLSTLPGSNSLEPRYRSYFGELVEDAITLIRRSHVIPPTVCAAHLLGELVPAAITQTLSNDRRRESAIDHSARQPAIPRPLGYEPSATLLLAKNGNLGSRIPCCQKFRESRLEVIGLFDMRDMAGIRNFNEFAVGEVFSCLTTECRPVA
jgi:hypothetical protein